MRGGALAGVLAGACCALALSACDATPSAGGAGDTRRYDVRGVVEDVDAAHGQVLLDHEDIPGLMPAMTMTFDVPNPELLTKLAAGQRIEAKLEVSEGHFRVVEARVVEERASAGRAGALGEVAGDAEPAADFSLTDQDGKTVSLASLRGKAVLLDFIYTHCPGPCPVLTARHAQSPARAPAGGARPRALRLDQPRPRARHARGAARLWRRARRRLRGLVVPHGLDRRRARGAAPLRRVRPAEPDRRRGGSRRRDAAHRPRGPHREALLRRGGQRGRGAEGPRDAGWAEGARPKMGDEALAAETRRQQGARPRRSSCYAAGRGTQLAAMDRRRGEFLHLGSGS